MRTADTDDDQNVPRQMAFWPDTLRGVPTSALRSALFAPLKRGQRQALQRQEIAAVGDFSIRFTGVTLDTSDLDVYEEILHRAKKSLGRYVQFAYREFLTAIGRSSGKSDRDWLLQSLSRLSACELEIKKDGKAYAGSLIQEQGRDDHAGYHYVMLAPRIATLFDHGYALRSPDMVQAIGHSPLAKWLYGFTLSQQRPLTWGIADLERYARSTYKRQRDFCNALDRAATYLQSLDYKITLQWDRPNGKVTIDPK